MMSTMPSGLMSPAATKTPPVNAGRAIAALTLRRDTGRMERRPSRRAGGGALRDQARVVIVGGGIAGCSIAYHLARKGWTDVLLFDKGELTSGSTWHAAGMVTHFHTSPTIMRMRQYSIRLYRGLQAEAGAPEHWHEVGSLRVASSRDQWLFLRRQVGTARA